MKKAMLSAAGAITAAVLAYACWVEQVCAEAMLLACLLVIARFALERKADA